MNIWDCNYFGRCQNSAKCMTCGPEQRLLKLPEDAHRKKAQAKARVTVHDASLPPEESWKELEDEVSAHFNAIPTLKEYDTSRRQPGSGNIWFMPGDVADEVVLAECKERGTVTAKGEKYISIPKAHLDKIAEEAKGKAYPAYVFRYHGDEDIYFVQEFEVLVDMVHEIKVLRQERKRLELENQYLKEQLKRRG